MDNDEWLTRKEAATYLKSLGIPIGDRTLGNKAANNNAGNGPAFYSFGWNMVRYKKADLDAWAKGRIRKVR